MEKVVALRWILYSTTCADSTRIALWLARRLPHPTSFCLRAHLCVHLLMSVPCRAADRSDLPWFRSLMVYKFFSPSSNFQACR